MDYVAGNGVVCWGSDDSESRVDGGGKRSKYPLDRRRVMTSSSMG
jgi:hypothetical protein